MSKHTLGEYLDIHGGGHDLQFPHHENEIAQSECAHGHDYVKTWMHVGFVNVDNEKMSKSLGNFFTIRDVVAQYSAEVVRFFLLSSHYRNPLNYTTENLDNARLALKRLYGALQGVTPVAQISEAWMNIWETKYNTAMDDDFSTPQAFAVLFELATELNKAKAQKDDELAGQLSAILLNFAGRLGILTSDPDSFLKAGSADELSEADIQAKLSARLSARQAKDFATSDAIRDELKAVGIEILDTPQGSKWRRM
jgi:cysteinyl-tRNA synthetase